MWNSFGECWVAGVMTEAWEGVASCLVERLHLEADDGTLDTKKLVRATAGMGGKDIWVSYRIESFKSDQFSS